MRLKIVMVILIFASLVLGLADATAEITGQSKELCFIKCAAGCRIAKGITFAESAYIYEDMSKAEWAKIPFGISPPSRPSVFVTLKEMQSSGLCPPPQEQYPETCSTSRYDGKYVHGYDIDVGGKNGRTILRVCGKDLEATLQNLTDLGQCQK